MYDDYLMHYGVLGQKWGVRHYQNEDGSYKPSARGRYNEDGGSITKSGKYKASNGIVVARSRNKAVDAMRRFSTTAPGRLMSNAGAGRMAKLTGRSKASIKEQSRKETAALKEYYKNGGDKMFDSKHQAERAIKGEQKVKAMSDVNSKVSVKEVNSSKGSSLKAAGYNAVAKIYDMNAKVYAKSNKTLSSMNAAAADDFRKKAESVRTK